MITDLQEAKAALDQLAKTVNASTRLTRDELLGTLARVYSIKLSDEDRAKLLEYVIEARRMDGANRAFLLKSSNQFILPLRYIFPGDRDRTNISRYAGALSELAEMNVQAHEFRQEVVKRGGLVELYWRNRERTTRVMRRNKIALDRNIEVVAGEEVTLVLQPQPSGIFRVLDISRKDGVNNSPASHKTRHEPAGDD